MSRGWKYLGFFTALLLSYRVSYAHSIVDVVKKIKPSVVGIGIHNPLSAPRNRVNGSGFVIADGSIVVTNYHVISKELDENSNQKRVVFSGKGKNAKVWETQILEVDELHDLAVLKIEGKLLPLSLGKEAFVEDGTEVAFTGFPIGAVLGLYPATHRGIIAATTPVIIPVDNTRQLSAKMLRRLRDPYFVYQMDATAYPGNSGSVVYDLEAGNVVAIINKVFVKETKEAVLSNPSGITYSIPVKYLIELLDKAGIDGY